MIWGFLSSALLLLVTSGLGAVVWLRRRYILARVTSDSMAPTFHLGDRVVVRRVRADRLRVGDVVVLSRPAMHADVGAFATPAERSLVLKRVLALPGDPVPREHCRALRDVHHDAVPPDLLVVVGDAGERSQDSKQLGYFHTADVVGLVPRAPGRPQV